MKWDIILLGSCLVGLGYKIVMKPVYFSYRYGFNVDFTGFNVPLGMSMAAAGVLFLWLGFTKGE